MTDDLRTRIANAIDDGHITYEQSLTMADAVICELVAAEWIRPDWEADDE